MNKAITLLSGGLDSTVATLLAAREFEIELAVTFDYGQRAASKETEAARSFCRRYNIKHELIALPWLYRETNTALVDREKPIPGVSTETLDVNTHSRAEAVWVPNRNGVFINIAASLAESRECDAVITGFNAEEAATFPDNSIAFIEAANTALLFSTRNGVRVAGPTALMSKDDIARKFVELDIDPTMLWCCYEGEYKLCGRCESCARTIRAFRSTGKWEMIKGRFAI